MKKYLLALAIFAVAATAVNAQEESVKSDGKFSVEVAFSPFNSSSNSVSLQSGQLKGAFAINDKWGVRLGLGFGAGSDIEDNGLGKDEGWQKTTSSSTEFSIAPGATFSFSGTNRMTPYVGAEFVVKSTFDKETIEGKDYKRVVTNDGSSNFNSFGGNIFAGFNYFFAKNLYVGVEFGIGLTATSYKNEKIETTEEGKTTTEEPKNDNSSFKFGVYANPALRLGWSF